MQAVVMENKMDTNLVEKMKTVLADSFAFALKAQYFHWNVEGPNFLQYHDLFGKIYEEVQDSIDHIAEQIRTLDAYAPGSFSRFLQLTTIQDEIYFPLAMKMVEQLYSDNQIVLKNLNEAFKAADSVNNQGLADFLSGRIDIHSKHAWFLRATLKGSKNV